ncbi:MAG: response regulator, partial [Acidobacteriota bacterium]|nr:response regulator [Acidobacteriota bacterium]
GEFERMAPEKLDATGDDIAVDSELDLLKDNLESLFDNQRRLIGEVREKLLRLRMIRFGSLSGRLQRTVRVACEEDEKSADLCIEGENLEIDTQILDCLIEPLLHLLRNAVAHGIEAPELRRLLGKSERGKISLRVESEKSRVVVAVSDDGRGISIDALKEKAVRSNFINSDEAAKMDDAEAFELMFLPGLTTAEKLSRISGRGVGMNIVKTNIERHQGAVSVSSEARKGTTFTLRVPTALTVARRSSGDSHRLFVMIVDDSPSVRLAASDLIKRAGWQPVTAENGFEALEILQNAPELPQVILTDAEMPRMDGYEFLAALKRQENLSRIPVVMITSQASDKHRQKAVDSGAAEYLTKPFEDESLTNKIKNLLKI